MWFRKHKHTRTHTHAATPINHYVLLLTTTGPMTANWSYKNLASSMSHAWMVTCSAHGQREFVHVYMQCVCAVLLSNNLQAATSHSHTRTVPVDVIWECGCWRLPILVIGKLLHKGSWGFFVLENWTQWNTFMYVMVYGTVYIRACTVYTVD